MSDDFVKIKYIIVNNLRNVITTCVGEYTRIAVSQLKKTFHGTRCIIDILSVHEVLSRKRETIKDKHMKIRTEYRIEEDQILCEQLY